MVEPQYIIENGLLLITYRNKQESFLEIAQGHIEMIKEIDHHHPSKILIDHRNVHYRANRSDAFNLVRMYKKHEERFTTIKLACCVAPEYFLLAKYWEELSIKTGFDFRAFDDMDEARTWLEN